ncbi:MAG: HDOD domain-containing protein [Pseudomonadota bacterium]|nr:MAG: hypothetical protein DIU78_01790 [Pseudomonadota bacterium]
MSIPPVEQDLVVRVLDRRRALDPDRLAEDLLETFGSPNYRPPVLPSVALELLSIARRPDVPIPAVVKLLMNEQILAARVLHLAQSALYGRGVGRTLTLGQAILRLGLKRIADIFMQAALEVRMFRVRGFEEPMNRLRRHSAATAEVARLVCQRTSLDDDHAFLCGLLHDVGMAASLIVLSDAAADHPVDFASAWPAIVEVHESAGRKLANLWTLPPEIGAVIEGHHGKNGFPTSTAAAVALADMLVTEQGAGIGAETSLERLKLACDFLVMGDEALEQLRADTARVLAELG